MRAVVLLSGGLDSVTTFALALSRGYACYALTINYGQRQQTELDAARYYATHMGAHEHRIVNLEHAQFGASALTDHKQRVPETPSPGIPITYVPARNTILLALALAWAEVIDASDIFIGVNAVDYSGYPDCRPEFICAFQNLARLATKAAIDGGKMNIEAPLIDMSKAEIIAVGASLGVDYARTVSCYQADERGRACGRCDACRLRRDGFREAAVRDPTSYY